MKRVVLSTALLLEDGTFKRTTISQEDAVAWAGTHAPGQLPRSRDCEVAPDSAPTLSAVAAEATTKLCVSAR